jgi:hypothetical protein
MVKPIRNTTGKPVTIENLHKRYEARNEAQKNIKPTRNLEKLDDASAKTQKKYGSSGTDFNVSGHPPDEDKS